MMIFWWLESGFSIRDGGEPWKSSIFGFSLFLAMIKRTRIYLLWTSLILLVIMVLFYMFWKIPWAATFGSIGLGILAIFLIGLLPELIKRGFIEKI